MKRCKKCNINFNTAEDYCPLCQNKLSGTSKESVFPTDIRFKTNVIILKMLAYISFVALMIVGFLELYTTGKIGYTLWVAAGLLTNYLIIYYMLKSMQNILSFFGKYGLVLVVITFCWFLATKSTILINYIIPSLCLYELIFNFTTTIVLKNNYVVNYISVILTNLVLLNLPLIFVLLGLTTSNLLSYICFLLEIVVIAGLLLFYLDDIKEGLSKVFNI